MAGIVYNASPTLRLFHQSDQPYRVVRGPVGSGKSSAMVMEMLRRAAQQHKDPKDGKRRTRGVIVRNTLPQLKNTSLKTILELIGPIIDWRPSENTVYVKQGDIEAEWILMPLDTPDNVQRLLSLDLTYAWLSELRELPPQIMLDVFGRCGRYPSMMHGGPSWYGVFGETNSFTEDSDWNTILELRELQGKPLPTTWGYWVQPGARDANAENKQNLVPGYYENLIESNSPEWVEQYVDNIIAPSLSGEAVFRSSFRRAFHVATSELQPIPGRLVIVGMDFGRNPAAVLTQMDLKGRLLVLDSLCQSNMGLEQFVISHLRPLLSSQRYMGCAIGVVGDPSGVARSQIGEESVFGALRRLGFSAQPAQTNAIEPRLRAVEKILLQQRDGGAAMLFSPHCEQLLMAISSRYRYAKRRDGDLQPQPDKGHPWSDLADALQYATLGYSGSISGRFMRPRKDERSEPRLKSAGWT